MLNEYGADPTIFSQILFSDEAQFKLNELINHHNSVYYDTVNPHIHYETQLNQQGILAGAGMSSIEIFDPYFFDRQACRSGQCTKMGKYIHLRAQCC